MPRAEARRLAFLLALPGIIFGTEPAAAQSLRGALEWLPPGSLNVQELTTRPAEALAGGDAQSFYVEYGRLAFRSPDVLGGNARKAGLSCHACHPNGHANVHFFVPRLSDKPGRIDVSNALWSARAEDNQDNPLIIPSLRGIKHKPRLGHDQRIGSLREFTRNVIVLEFDGAEPEPLLLDGLLAYLQQLPAGQASSEALTLGGDMADLRRGLGVLRLPLAEENAILVAKAEHMLRGQLGMVHERFEGEALRGPRGILEQWAAELRAITALAEASDWPAARGKQEALAAAWADPPAGLLRAEAESLYNPARLKVWLSKPTQ